MAQDPNRLADSGAQLERTSLAWSRTAFSMAACGVLVVRQGLVDDAVPLVVLGGLPLAASTVIWLLAASRYARGRSRPTRHLLIGHRYAVRTVTALAALVSCLAAAGALLALPHT